MEKKLKSYTIIPNELYVERAADVQLRNIVEDMGRPGYVLVSRQMGKTNLLLNAKRNLEDEDHIFLYADLSNTFPNIEQFFRHIIDIALETNYEKFKDVEAQIYEMRDRKRNLPSHREHEQELRLLLQCVKGKIVICLDEIDALTSSIYSDSVFSLIRSTYFSSRVNFSEFNRLTYILSGVAEPNDIIKNKNISPFNIGEKIYLDDFSYTEFENFLKKSELKLNEANAQRIFYWANGNPRICWDICSAIEDLLINERAVDPMLIDKMVQKLYLTEFDMAPVDHIRKIVEHDQDIRSAVINIHYGKFSSISDLQRNKLYLSGIIKSDYSDENISIKNKVIEISLNENWIREIENAKLSLQELASIKFSEGNYLEALILLRKQESAGLAGSDLQLLFHEIAKCCILLGEYENAIEYIIKNPFKKSAFTSLYYLQNKWLGNSYYRLGKLDESIECYEKVINSDFSDGDYPLDYFECLVNVTSVYSARFGEADPRILQCSIDVLSKQKNIREISISEEAANTIIVAAYHNLAKTKRSNKILPEASEAWKNAINIAKDSELPKLISEVMTVVSDDRKNEYLKQVVTLIREKNLVPSPFSITNPFNFSFSVYSDLIYFSSLLNNEKSKSFLVKYICSLGAVDFPAWKILRAAATSIINAGNYHAGAEIFKIAIDLPPEKVIASEKTSVLRYILLGDKYGLFRKYEEDFFNCMESGIDKSVADFDIKITYDIIDRHLDRRRISLARKIFEKFQSVIEKTESISNGGSNIRLNSTYIMIHYVELRLLVAEKNKNQTDLKAKYIKELIVSGISLPDFFPENMLNIIEKDVDYVLKNYFVAMPVSTKIKKYGRNDVVVVQYLDGTKKSGKYKNLQFDILSNECFVIN